MISTMGGRKVMMPSSFRNRNRHRRNASFSAESQKRKRERIERLREKRKGLRPSKVGADIEEDLKEKAVEETATHGVAQLFNAIRKGTEESEYENNNSLEEERPRRSFWGVEERFKQNTKMTNTEEEKDKKKRKCSSADDYMMGRGKMKDFDNANGFFDKHKNAGKNDDDGRLRDGEDDDDDVF